MHAPIVIHYCKAVVADLLRLAIGLVASLTLSFTLLVVQHGGITGTAALIRQWIAVFRSHALARGFAVELWIPIFVAATVGGVLLGPIVFFQISRWRYPRLDAIAILPDQAQTLSLPVGGDAIVALARDILDADVSLYDVRSDVATGRLTARSAPFSGSRGLFGARAGIARDCVGAPVAPSWKRRLQPYVDLPLVGRAKRSVDIAIVPAGAVHCDVTVRSRFRTLLPALDPFAQNRRTVNAIVDALTARTPRLIAEQRAQDERAQLEKRLLDARLQVLRAQIEPHFLYNTLANVQYLIRNDAAAADAMVGELIAYLRQSLPRMRDAESTLGGELALARAYLNVLRIRMGSRLCVTIDAPETLAAHPFPPMMLMSLVENAIKHGLEPKLGGGRIAIVASADGAMLRLEVRDDGVGFGAATGSGIGLRNIRETLLSMFDDRARLVVEPGAEQGVTAAIEIPLSGGGENAIDKVRA